MEPPRFYDRLAVGTLYLERAALVTEAATAARAAQGIPEARADHERIAAFGIDCQVAFCTPGASLFVPGAVEDTVRAIEWLYRHLARVTTLVLSLDTHSVHQIFHPASTQAAGWKTWCTLWVSMERTRVVTRARLR